MTADISVGVVVQGSSGLVEKVAERLRRLDDLAGTVEQAECCPLVILGINGRTRSDVYACVAAALTGLGLTLEIVSDGFDPNELALVARSLTPA